MDSLQRVTQARAPFGHQGAWIVTRCRGTDDAAVRQDLEIEPPPLEETLADTINWMVQTGHLPAKLAGDLAASDVRPPERVS
jgi:hypothetical protein